MNGIEERAYRRAAGVVDGLLGGQELIYAEITGALAGSRRVWLPFATSVVLLQALRQNDMLIDRTGLLMEWPDGCDAIYFGTPTIVGDSNLFPALGTWTKAQERETVRHLSAMAATRRARIVCGLGSGDVTLEERLEDVGAGAAVVCFKDFGEFQDWVIRRNT